MEFPVDVLGSVSHEELEQEAEDCLAELRYVTPDKAQSFTLNNHRKIRISLSNVGFVPVYGGDLRHKVLALFAPEDQLTAVALLLAGEWWTVEDILKTSDPSRAGLVKVRTLGEKIVLYVLNRIVYRVGEMAKPEVPFLCHSQHDFAKILWKDGQAVGFYSVKPKDSLSNNFVTQRYQLPVMDTIFLRKSHRGKGHGLQMLEDFVDSFNDDELGLKYPLSVAMFKVCSQYLYRYPADEDLLWVVEGIGGPYQKQSVASKLKALAPKVNLELFAANGDHQPENNHTDMDVVENEASSVNRAEITEDVVLVNKPLKLLEGMEDTPVSTRTRSSERKRPREETEDVLDEGLPSKVTRSEEREAEATTTTTSVVEETEGGEKEESSASVDEEADTEAAVSPEALVETEAAAEPPPQELEEVNGVMADGQADEDESEAEKEGEVEVPQEQESVLENGTGVEDVEMEGEREEEMKEQESTGEKENVDAAPMEAEEQMTEEEAEEQTAEEEAGEQTAEEEAEEGAGTASGEEPCSATEEASSPSDSAPEELSTAREIAEEAGDEPSGSPEAAESEEASAVPVEEEKEEKAMEESKEKEAEDENQEEGGDDMDTNQEAVLQVGVADLTYQPPEDAATPQIAEEEEAKKEEEGEKKELAEDAAVSSEEVGERSSDEAEEAPSGRGRGRRGRTTKRRSKRLIKTPAEKGDVKITEEEEDKVVTTEEEGEAVEKTSAEEEEETVVTTEEEGEAVGKTSAEEEEEEEEPPVVDQSAQRRKSRPVRSPAKSRGKRRSKT